MRIELTALEARVMGCLIEKEITTPEHYPLSLNALTAACNQRDNRDPLLDLGEAAVQKVVDGLVRKQLAIERAAGGARVLKYQQAFCNAQFVSRKLNAIETAVLCELLLRGPQTPGELRGHANRLCELTDIRQVDAALDALAAQPEGPLVARLAREPEQREHRYTHLLCGDVDAPVEAASPARPAEMSDEDRLARLEELVDKLGRELDALKRGMDNS